LTTPRNVISIQREAEIMKDEIDWENAFFLFAYVGCPLLAIVSVLASQMAQG